MGRGGTARLGAVYVLGEGVGLAGWASSGGWVGGAGGSPQERLGATMAPKTKANIAASMTMLIEAMTVNFPSRPSIRSFSLPSTPSIRSFNLPSRRSIRSCSLAMSPLRSRDGVVELRVESLLRCAKPCVEPLLDRAEPCVELLLHPVELRVELLLHHVELRLELCVLASDFRLECGFEFGLGAGDGVVQVCLGDHVCQGVAQDVGHGFGLLVAEAGGFEGLGAAEGVQHGCVHWPVFRWRERSTLAVVVDGVAAEIGYGGCGRLPSFWTVLDVALGVYCALGRREARIPVASPPSRASL